ncbi:MAG TPA: hypothetical protein VHP63_05930 [candidate division Zixibacteria bacterium]|nr:hypothetical protein [candidate division Zixibacteria bacterium]
MLDTIRLQNLPSYAKLFIALFTTLMLCVCAWAILILYVEKGMVAPSQIPPYVVEPYGQKDTTKVQEQMPEQKPEETPEQAHRRLKRNVKLAHTHINGQTLLFFSMGLIFLFTSAKPKTKRIVYWIFAVSVVVHNIGLTGENFHPLYEDMLIVSGILILASITYMAFIVYADLLKKPIESI